MARTIEIELPSGRKVAADVGGDGGDGFQEFGAASDAVKAVGRKLGDIADELRETLEVVAGKLENLTPRGADKITVELSAEIGTNGVLKVFGADAKSGLKVSLTWENKPPASKS